MPGLGSLAFNESSVRALRGAFSEMQTALNNNRSKLNDVNLGLQTEYRANSGTVFVQGLDKIEKGFAQIQQSLEKLQEGVAAASEAAKLAESANLSSASKVGGTVGQSSWT